MQLVPSSPINIIEVWILDVINDILINLYIIIAKANHIALLDLFICLFFMTGRKIRSL